MGAVAIVVSVRTGGTIGVAIALAVAVVAGVYLVYLLEILKWGGTPVVEIVRSRRGDRPGVAKQVVTAAMRGRASRPER